MCMSLAFLLNTTDRFGPDTKVSGPSNGSFIVHTHTLPFFHFCNNRNKLCPPPCVSLQRLKTQGAFLLRTQLPTSQRSSNNPPQRISPATRSNSKLTLDRSLSKRHVSSSGLARSSQISLSSHTTNADPNAPLAPQLQSSYSAPMPRSQSSNAFPRRGDSVPERSSAPVRSTPSQLPRSSSLQPLLQEVDMKIRLGQLLGQPVMSRYNGTLIDMVRLEGEMMERSR